MCTLSTHHTRKLCWNKGMFLCSRLYLDYNLAKQTGSKQLRIFLVFVLPYVFDEINEINKLWSNKVLSIMSVCPYSYFSYSLGKTHILWVVLYYLLWPARLSHMFLIRGKIFSKQCKEHKMYVLIFSRIFVWSISYSKTNSARDYHKCT
jgi:hypothetical protein